MARGRSSEQKLAEQFMACANQFTFNPGLLAMAMMNGNTVEGRINVMRAVFSLIKREADRYDMNDMNEATLFAARVREEMLKFEDYQNWS